MTAETPWRWGGEATERGGGRLKQQYLEGEISGKQLSRRRNDIDSVKLNALAGG